MSFIHYNRRFPAPKVTAFAAALLALLLAGVTAARAGDVVKANNNTVLSTGTSWVGSVAPSSSDNAKFDSTVSSTASATIGAGLSVNGIIVVDTGVNFTISANTTHVLTIGAGGVDLSSANNSSNNFTIAAVTTLGATQSFNVASGRTLTVSGAITNGGFDLTTTGAGTITISGAISGAGNFIQAGNSGTTTLGANNNGLTGNVVVRAGTLQIQGNNNALGTGNVTLGDASTLGTDNTSLLISSASRTYSTNITVANYGNISSLGGSTASGTSTFSGNITLNKDTTLTEASGGIIKFTGNITGAYNITKDGAGTITLNGTNDAKMGSVTISAGTLSVGGSNAIGDYSLVNITSGAELDVTANETIGSLSGAGNVVLTNAKFLTVGNDTTSTTYSGVMGTGSGGLTKAGTGTLTMNGANSYTGATTINAGTLLLDLSTNTAGVLSSSSKPTLGGGTLDVKGKSSGTSTQTLGNPTLTANTSNTIIVDANGGSGTTLTLGNTWTRGAGSTLLVDISSTGSNVTASPTVTNGIINASILVKDGTATGFGAVSGGNIARYTGGSQLTSAATTSTTNYYENTTGTLTLSGTESVNTLTLNGTSAGTLDLKGGTLSLTGLGLLDTATAAVNITNGTLGANNKEVILHQLSGSTLTISATLSGGSGSLTKDGSGNVNLTANNSFTGATVVAGGTLTLSASGANKALASTSAIIITNGGTVMLGASDQINTAATVTLNTGTFAFNGKSLGTASTAGVGALTLSADSTLDLGSGANVVAFSDSSAAAWTADRVLTITNWTSSDQLYFGTTNSGLTGSQLSEIQFVNPFGDGGNWNAGLDANGRLIPAPEPATYFAGGILATLAALAEWRRRRTQQN